MYENTNLKSLNHLNNSVGGLAKKPHISSCRRLACCSVLSNNLTNSLENFLYPSSCLHFQSYNFPKCSCPKPKMVLLLHRRCRKHLSFNLLHHSSFLQFQSLFSNFSCLKMALRFPLI